MGEPFVGKLVFLEAPPFSMSIQLRRPDRITGMNGTSTCADFSLRPAFFVLLPGLSLCPLMKYQDSGGFAAHGRYGKKFLSTFFMPCHPAGHDSVFSVARLNDSSSLYLDLLRLPSFPDQSLSRLPFPGP